MKTPAVTVVIPNYNYASYLPECIESVLAQTYKDWELIVVDDTSTDESCSVAKRYVAQHPEKIRLIRLTGGPAGTPRAINAGVRAMRGQYFSWLSSDDRCAPTKLERLVEILENTPAAGMVHSAYCLIDKNGVQTGVTIPIDCPGVDSFYRLIEGNIINGSAVLIHKELLDEIGPLLETDKNFPNLWLVAEYLWWLEIALRTDVALISQPLHDFRIHSVNQAYNNSSFGPELAKIALRRFLEKYGLSKLCSILAARGQTSKADVYRRIIFALEPHPIDEDVALFRQAFRCENDEEMCSIAARSERTVWNLLNRAKQTFSNGDYQAAAGQFQNILNISARFTNLDLSARFYLALSLEKSNDVTRAMTLFETVLAAEPRHAKAREGLARIRNGKNITANQLACSSRSN
jgi:tetratricopeptide (TPR) repeat protein